jgi:bifunctional DNA-binding transcriptional regulator/antitoxin component of YhaV-PrlF toxin-antitoxin module
MAHGSSSYSNKQVHGRYSGKIRAKYDIAEGPNVEFVDAEDGIRVIPLKSLRELRGAFKDNDKTMKQSIGELEQEHREEARS